MRIRRQFRDVREDVLKMTQADLAAAINCSRQHVSRVERGIAEYNFSQIESLAALSGLPISALFDDSPIRVPGWWLDYVHLPPLLKFKTDVVLGSVVALVRPVVTPAA